MKKLLNSPKFVVLTTLIIAIALMLIFVPESRAQSRPMPDSIQVYQFTVLPANLNTGIKILQEKFLKNGKISDTVLLNSSLQMLLGNGKMIKIANPELPQKKIVSPKNK